MRVLGIDPGIGRVGLAIVEKAHPKQKVLMSECLETDKSLPHNERVLIILNRIDVLLKEYNPEIVALEKIFFAKNKKTAIDVSETKGSIKALLLQNNYKIMELTPNEIKLCITGQGNADKKQIEKMLKYIVLIDNPNKKMLDDEVDAIAIGVCCIINDENKIFK